MTTVKISPKYQVVIPKEVRQQLQLKPGQKLAMFVIDGRVEMVPVIPIRKLRGFIKGIDTTIERDEDRL